MEELKNWLIGKMLWCEKRHFSGVFPMFVPSLSWQNVGFSIVYIAQKCRFSQGPIA
jgi:hypothetical protein